MLDLFRDWDKDGDGKISKVTLKRVGCVGMVGFVLVRDAMKLGLLGYDRGCDMSKLVYFRFFFDLLHPRIMVRYGPLSITRKMN